MRNKLLALGLALVSAPLAASTWHFDKSHTLIGFEIVHLGVTTVHGRFKDYTGTINLDDKDLAKSSVSLEIPVASVDTGAEKRDQDLQGDEFFGAEKNPKITFKSTKVEKDGKDWKLTGDLTIHGVTKPVTLKAKMSEPFKTDWGAVKRAFSLRATINRFDYGVSWGKKVMGGTLVAAENVDLVIDSEIDQD